MNGKRAKTEAKLMNLVMRNLLASEWVGIFIISAHAISPKLNGHDGGVGGRRNESEGGRIKKKLYKKWTFKWR